MGRSPFAWIDGQPHLVVNYQLDLADELPPLAALLEGLLRHHDPTEVVLLRPLSTGERRRLQTMTCESEIEAWAHIVVSPDDRFRARPAARRRPR
jgi:hypothetical protein